MVPLRGRRERARLRRGEIVVRVEDVVNEMRRQPDEKHEQEDRA